MWSKHNAGRPNTATPDSANGGTGVMALPYPMGRDRLLSAVFPARCTTPGGFKAVAHTRGGLHYCFGAPGRSHPGASG